MALLLLALRAGFLTLLLPAWALAQQPSVPPDEASHEPTEWLRSFSLPRGVGGEGTAAGWLSPQEWAQGIVGNCLEEERRWQESLAALEADLEASALSEEQLAFPQRERGARRKSLGKDRRRTFARLDYLLLGRKAKSLKGAAKDLQRAAGLPRLRGKSPLRHSLGLVLREASPCSLEGLESTLFLAIFDVPFTRERFEAGLDRERVYAGLDRTYHERLEKLGSLEGAYRTLRPQDPEIGFRYVDELIARLATLGALPKAELHTLLRQLQRTLRLAAEPVRIQTYLHTKVEELEGALRTSIPETTIEKLFGRAEKVLYRNEKALSRLSRTAPPQVLATLEQILDRWFRKQALRGVQKAVYRDPFLAYWFFVQSGMVARGRVAFKGSRVDVGPEILELESLKGLSLAEAVSRLQQDRIPASFVEAHAALERVLTDVTLDRDAALQQLAASSLSPKEGAKLQQYVRALEETQTLSTVDAYSQVVRDANRIGGAADWDLVRGTLQVLRQAKQERLRQAAALESARAQEAERLARHLGTLSELMLELELRQATDRRFQEATGGGFTRWLIRDFLMTPGVPIHLWVPGGVTGKEFAELLDEVAPKNAESGNLYHGKAASEIRLVHDGREFHRRLVEVIDTAASFLNIAAYDWKLDQGGKQIAYRLMGKKLGIEGEAYDRFLAAFRNGLPLEPGAEAPTLFYDIPPARMKNLLVYFFFTHTDLPAIVALRRRLEGLLAAALTCPTVMTCGDLATLHARAGATYDPGRAAEPGTQEVWGAYRELQALFEEDEEMELRRTRPRRSLAAYVADGGRLRRFVRRYGRKREDNPTRPFPINIIVDAKQNLSNVRLRRASRQFPYFFSDPFWDIYAPLLEFAVRLLFWKGPVEFPWHLGPLPLPGRKVLGVVPLPYLPYPWLRFVPGLGLTGTGLSLFLQHLLATDPRIMWGMAMHTKSISSESHAIETGMGIASKYFNAYPGFSTWHDMGVKVTGPIVGDVNDHFVRLFNHARVNNAGVPASRGVKAPRLRYEDYRSAGASAAGYPAWVMTTHPEKGDYNYRGVFMAALAAARKNIYIENVSFTDPLVARMLVRKAREFRGRVNCAGLRELPCAEKMRAGVKIYLVLPDSTDQPLLDVVLQAYLHEMLHLGVKIYRWNPTWGWSARKMLHTKAWLIDYEAGQPALAYVGSANATQRSHLADNELGIVSTSPEFAREVHERLFRPDLTSDARRESTEKFHISWSRKRLARTGRWLRHLLVDLFWFF